MIVRNRSDFALGAGWAAFCVFGLLWLVPRQVGPLLSREALLPTGSFLFMLLLSVVLVMKSLRTAGPPVHHETRRPQRRQFLTATAVMVGYAFLMESTGFLLTSTAGMVLLLLTFGLRDWRRIVALVVPTVVLLYLFFEKALNAPLPLGSLLEGFLDFGG